MIKLKFHTFLVSMLNDVLIVVQSRCVALDMRGYNDSSKPRGIRQYSIDCLTADVKAAVEGKVTMVKSRFMRISTKTSK